MLIKSKDNTAPKSFEITPETSYWSRREWLKSAGIMGAGLAALSSVPGVVSAREESWQEILNSKLASSRKWAHSTQEPPTPYKDVISYNNFYEFGTGKSDPVENSKDFKVDPWRVHIAGEVGKPGRYTLEDIFRPHPLEDRVYRFRCVEAWSMVVPWVGFPLADLLKRFEPTTKAKYVRFETLVDPDRFPGQRFGRSTISWPYVEGLRMDEAMHPLTLMVVGVYGKTLLPQNGAPLRLMVPWKYGFKSIKSIVKIEFLEKEPKTTWQQLASQEYGFFANVNPEVDHPRWSQKRERRLPNSIWDPNWMPTQKFNGYEEQVASLYAGMNLRTHF
ncbi:protein-methionine-sulfoxide reductase catalytic subunit MsrP [Alcanivorax jadensis]|uniref:protein-methionine-sulfoxide reductase catalytic subunit MsrP n=1 Tax=Alcanivorax jadensis TaxID=64988 RepID=UPI002409C6E8|nr:protein-methionine-sulfoxide reductase catalytic subunit MsrP [Alcanivorax jadensis]MDF1639283.1 protein-methionine-sulfoxide reductase catalytic subunit MsrP [Alcanivorax jadensis]